MNRILTAASCRNALNVDDNQEVAGRYRVRSIPTMVVLRGGKEVDRMVGALPPAEIERRLARLDG